MFQFYCCDIYGHLDVSKFIKEAVILQFINVVWMIADRLECINKEVASCLEIPVKLSRSKCVLVRVPFASKTERTPQNSPLECGNEDTGALISDFPVFTGTCPSFSEVEN